MNKKYNLEENFSNFFHRQRKLCYFALFPKGHFIEVENEISSWCRAR